MDRLVSGNPEESQIDFEESIRPQTLDEYIGQFALKDNLRIFIEAARGRGETLDHLLFYGPPGLGKTTLAYIIAHEMQAGIKVTSGPSIERAGDLAAVLSSLEPGDILFIDEIHRIPKAVEEVLYPAMEDFTLDLIVGKDSSSRSIQIDLPPFTLIGATTRAGDLSSPLRDRFGIISKLEYYSHEELEQIVSRTGRVMQTDVAYDAQSEIARRSRGTPRIANRLFRRVRDFAQVLNDNTIDLNITQHALDKLKVDALGLDEVDIRYLKGIIDRFDGGPVGLDALAASISEETMTLEDVYEPYLLQLGFINRTPRGRVATARAYEHLKIERQASMFE